MRPPPACRMEIEVIQELVTTAVLRLQIGILQRESIETLYRVNAPISLYDKLNVRQIIERGLLVGSIPEQGRRVIKKLDHLETNRPELEAAEREMMEQLAVKTELTGRRELARKSKEESKGKILDVITLDDDSDDEKTPVNPRNRKEKRKDKQKRRKSERKMKESSGKVDVSTYLAKEKNTDALMINGEMITRDNLPVGWNNTMFNFELCYRNQVLKKYSSRLEGKAVSETWTVFYKRCAAEEMSELLSPNKEIPTTLEKVPEVAKPSTQFGKPSPSASTAPKLQTETSTDRVPLFRFPQNVWSDLKNMQ